MTVVAQDHMRLSCRRVRDGPSGFVLYGAIYSFLLSFSVLSREHETNRYYRPTVDKRPLAHCVHLETVSSIAKDRY